MVTMSVSLPEPTKRWVESQSRGGRYSNASDYVRDLIRRDQERVDAIRSMQAMVDEGLSSGIGDKSMAEIEAEALQALDAQPGGRGL